MGFLEENMEWMERSRTFYKNCMTCMLSYISFARLLGCFDLDGLTFTCFTRQREINASLHPPWLGLL